MVTLRIRVAGPGGQWACTRMPATVAVLIGHVSGGRADYEITEVEGSVAVKGFDAKVAKGEMTWG